MKKLILLSFVLIVNLSFSQTERNNNVSTNSFNFTSVLEQRNNSFNERIITNDVGEIVSVDFSLPTNNSEGKFTVYDANKGEFLNKKNKTNDKSILITNNGVSQNKSFTSENHNDFINSIVLKMELNKQIRFSNSFIKENENIKIPQQNKSLYSVANLSENKIEIVLGGLNLNPEKVYTSELEHSVRHSLNLLVLNF
jgi:hypothetical protein